MMPPAWMNDVIRDFGKAAGADALALNERGAAALKFETGVSLRLEFTGEELVMAMFVPSAASVHVVAESLKRLLSFSHPKARVRLRTGYQPKTGCLVAAVRLAVREVTLPNVNAAFSALWRAAGEIGGSAWA